MKNVMLAISITALVFSGGLNYAFLSGKFAKVTLTEVADAGATALDNVPMPAPAAPVKLSRR